MLRHETAVEGPSHFSPFDIPFTCTITLKALGISKHSCSSLISHAMCLHVHIKQHHPLCIIGT